MNKTCFSLFTELLAACCLMVSSFAQADSVPKLINYQGKLTNPAGEALSGIYTLKFEIFDAPAGGVLVWGETQEVSIANGVFSVFLGSGEILNPLPPVTDLTFAFGEGGRYLETTIVSGLGIIQPQSLSPRQELVSVPFAVQASHAQNAENAELLAGMSPSWYMPIGSVIAFAGEEAPLGWLLCDGQAVLREEYRNLFEVIGVTYGSSHVSNFHVPDYRGRFLRGVTTDDTNADERDPDWRTSRVPHRQDSPPDGNGHHVGSVQEDAIQNITASTDFYRGYGNPSGSYGSIFGNSIGAFSSGVIGNHDSPRTPYRVSYGGASVPGHTRLSFDASRAVRTAPETRPKNVYVNYIIKY